MCVFRENNIYREGISQFPEKIVKHEWKMIHGELSAAVNKY
jgi:hypothetical protein